MSNVMKNDNAQSCFLCEKKRCLPSHLSQVTFPEPEPDFKESFTVENASFMSPPPCNGTTFFRRCLLGAYLSKFLTKIKVLDGTLRYCVARSQRPTTTTTSILRPIRSQFYVQFDLSFTSNSTSILRPIRPQFYIQFDLNFTSNSTSILCPIRSQWDNFFLPTVRSCIVSSGSYMIPMYIRRAFFVFPRLFISNLILCKMIAILG